MIVPVTLRASWIEGQQSFRRLGTLQGWSVLAASMKGVDTVGKVVSDLVLGTQLFDLSSRETTTAVRASFGEVSRISSVTDIFNRPADFINRPFDIRMAARTFSLGENLCNITTYLGQMKLIDIGNVRIFGAVGFMALASMKKTASLLACTLSAIDACRMLSRGDGDGSKVWMTVAKELAKIALIAFASYMHAYAVLGLSIGLGTISLISILYDNAVQSRKDVLKDAHLLLAINNPHQVDMAQLARFTRNIGNQKIFTALPEGAPAAGVVYMNDLNALSNAITAHAEALPANNRDRETLIAAVDAVQYARNLSLALAA